MKVIGKRNSTLIVEIDQHELANLLGHYYMGADGCPRVEPGDVVSVSGMYTHLSRLKQKSGVLKQTAHELRELADVLESKDPVLKAALADSEAEAAQ